MVKDSGRNELGMCEKQETGMTKTQQEEVSEPRAGIRLCSYLEAPVWLFSFLLELVATRVVNTEQLVFFGSCTFMLFGI